MAGTDVDISPCRRIWPSQDFRHAPNEGSIVAKTADLVSLVMDLPWDTAGGWCRKLLTMRITCSGSLPPRSDKYAGNL
jgi:hypothetical protein